MVSELEEDIERVDQPYTVEVRVADGEVLAPTTLHTLVLRDSLTDLEGNPLLAEVRVEFTTQP